MPGGSQNQRGANRAQADAVTKRPQLTTTVSRYIRSERRDRTGHDLGDDGKRHARHRSTEFLPNRFSSPSDRLGSLHGSGERTMSEPRIVATGLSFPEGPVAMRDGSVVLVEIERQTVTRVLPDGTTQVIARTGGGPNGLAVGPDGAFYICNNGGFAWRLEMGLLRPAAQARTMPAAGSNGSTPRPARSACCMTVAAPTG